MAVIVASACKLRVKGSWQGQDWRGGKGRGRGRGKGNGKIVTGVGLQLMVTGLSVVG